MRAIVHNRYGPTDALRVAELPIPAIAADEVLVRVRAASVHPDVWHVVRGRPHVLRLMGAGLRRPKQPVPGTDLAGPVAAVGAQVTRFQRGDEVFGESLKGYSWRNGGAFAEYAAVPAEALVHKPANVTFEQAAAVPTSALIALRAVRDEGRVQPGRHVLVNGAAGGVGIFAVQLAQAFGADVTGVDAAEKLDLLRSLGAHRVIDMREDFTRGSERYDLIVDIPGNRPFTACRRALTPNGTYVLVGHDGFGASAGRWLGSLPKFLWLAARSPFTSQLPSLSVSMPSKRQALAVLADLIAAGRLTPLVDRTFPLEEVPAAIRYLESGRARGKVVVTV